MKEIRVALIGTPNVGKSTIYNALTRSHEHTGNWAGKTVEFVNGECVFQDTKYIICDLPGTYSIIAKSKEEQVATDFILSSKYDVAVVVLDATNLAKGINLVIQTKELCKKIVVCVNLEDEANKKGIIIDYERLANNLECPVVKTSARNHTGLRELLEAIRGVEEHENLRINYDGLEEELKKIESDIREDYHNKRWVALRVLENNQYYIDKFQKEGILKITNNTKEALEEARLKDVSLEVVIKISLYGKKCLRDVITYKKENTKGEKFDKIITSKILGIPIMLVLLFGIFYLTIVGANYPSDLLFTFFSSLEDNLFSFLEMIHLPDFLTQLLVNGVYKTLYWVISVMMIPMLIFFPLFSFLEELGLLPRIAFNLDKYYQKCNVCGKQALTMCMGIGCNAVGVTGARIIDSKRERIIAILTNVFMPCNGKFPALIAITSIFMVGLNKSLGSVLCALILTGFILLGILVTFLVSYILSKTILKGEAVSFTMEIPPYRMPRVGKTIWNSVKTRAIFVLFRAIKVAIPAGVLIWIVANFKINDVSLLVYLTDFLNPVGVILGIDGVILLALLLGFPANEIVIPIMLMCYLKTSTLIDYDGLETLRSILVMNGWTIKTALCFLILLLYRFPCSTTLLTIKKETNSLFYTFLSVIIPVTVGIILCLIINLFDFII